MKKKKNLPETPGEIASYFTAHQMAAWKKEAEGKLRTYLFVMSKRHRWIAWCSHCHHFIRLDVSHHRKETACPHCGSVGEQIHGWRGYSRLHDNILVYSYAYSGKGGGALVVASVNASVWWHGEDVDWETGKKKLVMPWRIQPTVLLDSVSVFRPGEGGVMACPSHGRRPSLGGTLDHVKAPRGREGCYTVMGFSTLRKVYADEDEFLRAVKRTPFRYTLDELTPFERVRALEIDGALPLLEMIAHYPFAAECLAKMGKPLHDILLRSMYRIATNVVNWRGKTLKSVLRGTLTKEEKAWLRSEKGAYITPTILAVWQALRRSGNQETLLPDMVAMGYDKRLYDVLPDVAPVRILHYLKKKGIRESGIYADYISMCREEGVDLTQKANLFPRDLTRAHDAMIEHRRTRWELERRERQRKAAREKDLTWEKRRAAIVKRYGFAAGGIIIRVPEKLEELIDEGNAMHSCVGTYVGRVAAGDTIVVFIRTEDTDERLGTMEIAADGTHIVQARAAFNAELPQDVQAFVEKFEAEKIKPAIGMAG